MYRVFAWLDCPHHYSARWLPRPPLSTASTSTACACGPTLAADHPTDQLAMTLPPVADIAPPSPMDRRPAWRSRPAVMVRVDLSDQTMTVLERGKPFTSGRSRRRARAIARPPASGRPTECTPCGTRANTTTRRCRTPSSSTKASPSTRTLYKAPWNARLTWLRPSASRQCQDTFSLVREYGPSAVRVSIQP